MGLNQPTNLVNKTKDREYPTFTRNTDESVKGAQLVELYKLKIDILKPMNQSDAVHVFLSFNFRKKIHISCYSKVVPHPNKCRARH